MSVFTNLVFSLLSANSGRSLFEVAAAITAHPIVAKKIRRIKRHPHTISPPTSTSAEPEKLNKLEQELTKLREEIGLLMQAKLQLAHKPDAAATPAPAPAKLGVPPPPPPPPTRKSGRLASAQTDAAAAAGDSASVLAPEVIKSKIKKPIAVSLHQVIASGQPVALRRVEHNRSPGGTPIKGAGLNAKMLDHSTFLSQALKRKFKHAHNDSPPTTPAGDITPEPAPQARTSRRNINVAIAEETDVTPAAVAPTLASSVRLARQQPKTPVKHVARQQSAPVVSSAPVVEEQSLINFDAVPQPAAPAPEQLLISFEDIAPSPVPALSAPKQAVDDLFLAFSTPAPEDKENSSCGTENKPQSPSAMEKRKARQASATEQVEEIASPSIKRAATSVRTT